MTVSDIKIDPSNNLRKQLHTFDAHDQRNVCTNAGGILMFLLCPLPGHV